MPDVVWIHYARPRSTWYELDHTVRDDHLMQFELIRKDSVRAGGQHNGTFHVRGNSDFSTVEIWGFPDADAAFQHWNTMTSAGYARWFTFANNIGLRRETPS